MAHTFRTHEEHVRYKEHNKLHPEEPCALCYNETITDFLLWRIHPANFPYDSIASVHHMLVPKRHVVESGLTPEEIQELFAIKQDGRLQEYDYLLEAVRKSRPTHFHLHLLVAKTTVST